MKRAVSLQLSASIQPGQVGPTCRSLLAFCQRVDPRLRLVLLRWGWDNDRFVDEARQVAGVALHILSDNRRRGLLGLGEKLSIGVVGPESFSDIEQLVERYWGAYDGSWVFLLSQVEFPALLSRLQELGAQRIYHEVRKGSLLEALRDMISAEGVTFDDDMLLIDLAPEFVTQLLSKAAGP